MQREPLDLRDVLSEVVDAFTGHAEARRQELVWSLPPEALPVVGNGGRLYRNNTSEPLGMSAVYSPPGFEQAFKDRLIRPNRTPAEVEESRKKHGIVYRDPPR